MENKYEDLVKEFRQKTIYFTGIDFTSIASDFRRAADALEEASAEMREMKAALQAYVAMTEVKEEEAKLAQED